MAGGKRPWPVGRFNRWLASLLVGNSDCRLRYEFVDKNECRPGSGLIAYGKVNEDVEELLAHE